MCMQEIAAGQDVSGGIGSEKLRSVLGNYVSPQKILKQLKESPVLYYKYQQLSPALQQKFLDFCAGISGLSICYDPVFKSVFHPENHPERLSRFLSCVIGQKVKVKRVLVSEGNRIVADSSLVIMDIVVELQGGTIGNVEIQKIPYMFPGQRAACYTSDLVLRQYTRLKAEKGKKSVYKNLKPVYTIVIFETSSREFHAFPHNYIHRGSVQFDTGLKVELLQNYIYIPLDLFRKIHHNQGINSELEAWLAFLAYDDPEHIWELQERCPYFRELYQDLADFRKDVKGVLYMFSEALAILDKNTVEYMVELQEKELKKRLKREFRRELKKELAKELEKELAKKLEKELAKELEKGLKESNTIIRDQKETIGKKDQTISQLQDSRQQAFLLGVKNVIETFQDFGLSREDAKARLIEKYALPQAEADEYMTEYWK